MMAALVATPACGGGGDGGGAADGGGADDGGGDGDAPATDAAPDAAPLETGCPPGYEGTPEAEGGDGCVLQNPRLTAPSRLVRGRTFTLRAQILGDDGNVDPTGCFAELGAVSLERVADGASVPITVTTFDAHTAVPDDAIRFYHGVGSVSFTLDDGVAAAPGEYRLIVDVGGRRATNVITVLAEPAWRVMPAVLAGDDLVWGPDEEIRIAEHDTLVPSGSMLTIHPGTSIMVDTTGGFEDGTLLHVAGRIEAVGELDRAIHIFSERGPAAMTHTVEGTSLSNADAWRGIDFTGGASSTLRWVILTGAGNGVVVSHPRPPILNLRSAEVVVEDSVFTDSTGMMFQSPGTGNYVIRRSLVSRVGIGAEFLSSGHTVLVEDSWWTGIGHGPTEPLRFDGDGIHIDGFGSDQTLRRCVVVDIGDDGIDHSNSTFTIEETVVHDIADKAVSMTNGEATIRDSLLFGAPTGVRGVASVHRSTIATGEPIMTPVVVEESIIWPETIATCDADVDHSIVGDEASLGCGDGNLSADPVWTDPSACDYTPAAGSPALTAGAGGCPIGWPGYPTYAP
jgi:hypothetical protein